MGTGFEIALASRGVLRVALLTFSAGARAPVPAPFVEANAGLLYLLKQTLARSGR